MSNKKVIVVEGATDGIGKTTQFNLLKERLVSDGEVVINHHFPTYNTPQGKLAEMYLAGELGDPKEISPYYINSLYAIDRAVTWNQELKKEYEAGHIILLDRYTTSSILYQSSVIDDLDERKRFIEYICDFEYHKLGIKEPDKVIFLSAPFEVAEKMRLKRKDNDGIVNDIHESNRDYLLRVYENAMFVADYLNWDTIECSKNDEMLEIDEISQKVYSKVKK